MKIFITLSLAHPLFLCLLKGREGKIFLQVMASSAQKERDLVLRIIYNELGKVSHKWFKIGIQLGIPHYKLKEFEEERDPLSAVIEYWLAGNVPESDVPVSWESIVAALKVDSVGEPGLAEQIYKQYCLKVKAGLTPTKSEQLKKKSENIDEVESAGQPAQLDPDIKMDLEVILEENLDEITMQYANYVKCLCDILKEKAVSPEDLRSFLMSLPAFSKAFKGQNSALLADQKAELAKKNTVNEIFDFLTMKCASFLNYDIFQKIIKAYSISTKKEELRYCDHLKAYICKHKISEFIEINPLLKSNESTKELTLKFDIENTCTLARVDELKKTLAKILKLKSSALHIVDIEDGCIVVTFLIPVSVADILFTPDTVFTPQQEDELRAQSVLWLKCNGYTCNFKKIRTKIQGLRKLEEQLTCSICLGTYADPKLLQCNHSYCQQCLSGLVQQDQQGQLTLPCPTCRQITPVSASGVAGLPSDFRANQLLEILGHDLDVATERVSTFKLQQTQAANHEDVTTEKRTRLSPFVFHCPEHEKEVSLYCHTCSESICLKCAMKDGAHQGHVCEELEEAFKKCKETIALSLVDIESALAHFDTCRGQLSDQRQAIEEEIHSTILPDARKTELIGQLHLLNQAHLKNLAMQRDQIETIQIQLKKLLHPPKEDRVHLTKGILEAKKLTSALQSSELKLTAEVGMKLSDIVDITTECQLCGLVSANFPDPSKSFVTGDGISTSTIGEETLAVLHTLDLQNQPCKGINMNSIRCQLISQETGKAIRCGIKRRDESHYDISYKPTIYGRHQLQIQIKGQHIRGSPLSISVKSTPVNVLIKIFHGVKGHGGIAVNHKKEVIVANKFGEEIVVFGPKGDRLQSFPMLSSSAKVANQLAVDGDGNIFVTDSGNHCIRKFSPQGDPLVEVDFADDDLYNPCAGIAICKDRIYVVTGDYVRMLTSSLKGYSTFGINGSGEGQFNCPQNIACDDTGNVYVADRGNSRIQVFTPEGEFLRMFGNKSRELVSPHGIAIAGDRVYVSDWDTHCVYTFTLTGEFVTLFGGIGTEPGQFLYPRGLAVDSEKGVLYVCDTENGRIQIFRVA